MRTYLIDGYNLLYQVPELTGRQSEELEDQRERLIRRLIGLSAGRKIRIQIVFDTSRLQHGRTDYPGVRVDYASPSADAFIRRLVSQNQGNRNLVVVSSDRKDIGHYAKTCGVEWMTSQQFWGRITRRSKKSKSSITGFEKEGTAPPGWTEEDDAWLRRIFETRIGENRRKG